LFNILNGKGYKTNSSLRSQTFNFYFFVDIVSVVVVVVYAFTSITKTWSHNTKKEFM
jgi:hypothetical protein